MPTALVVAAAALPAVVGDLSILVARRRRRARAWRRVAGCLRRRHTLVAMVLEDVRRLDRAGAEAARAAAALGTAVAAGTGRDPAGTARAERELGACLAALLAAVDDDPRLRSDARLRAPLDRLAALDGPLRAALAQLHRWADRPRPASRWSRPRWGHADRGRRRSGR